ncbi:MAG: hypothetical protein ABW175_26430 [Bradyrhizobium sp.]
MRTWLSAAFVAGALVVVGPGAIAKANAAPSANSNGAGASTATDFGAHRHHRRHHRHTVYSRKYAPAYYARPVFYRPYPYQTPVPFFLGIGFGPAL